MAKQECVTLFPEVEDVTRRLSDAQFGALIRAVMGYQLRDEAYTGDDMAVDIAFRFLCSQVDRTNAFKEAKAKAARQRWDRQKQTEAEQDDAQRCTPMQGDAPEARQGGGNPPPAQEKPKRTAFKPPEPEEVREYCRIRGKGVDPERWYNHYSANGWMVGRNKMKDWKAAVRTWEQKEKPGGRSAPAAGGNPFLDMLKKGGCL